MLPLLVFCLSFSPITKSNPTTVPQQFNQASTIALPLQSSTVPQRATFAQNRVATSAIILPTSKAAPPKLPPQYESTNLRKKEGEPKFFEQPAQYTQSSGGNIYRFDHITSSAHDRIDKCSKPPSCTTYRAFYGYALDEYSMIDSKRKILMEFSPKSDCTAAVVAFLEASGYTQNIDYFGWPHIFRERYYDTHCGEATYCNYYDPSWFRFKIVRNPFDRAVSSYLYIMKTSFLNDFLPKHIKKSSFEEFINYLLTLSPDNFQYFCTRHAGPQSQYYERFVYIENHKEDDTNTTTATADASSNKKYPSVFHEIVKVEDPKDSFDRIYKRTGVRYQLKYSSKQHFQSRNKEIHSFVGNVTWDELSKNNHNNIPQNYGYFYNQDLKEKVEKLYYWDLLLYNYTFPF